MSQEEWSAALGRLDPERAEDTEELRHVLDRLDPTQPGRLADFLRVADLSPDKMVVAQAQALAACILFERGDEQDADRLFRESVAVLWGSGLRVEVTALINYALLRLRRGHAYEALLLARRAADTAPAWAPYAESLAHLYRAGACMHLRDWDAFDDCLLDAAATETRLNDAQRGYVRKVSASFRLAAAFESDHVIDVAGAMAAIAASAIPRDSWAYVYHEGLAHLLDGRPEEALRAHDRLAEMVPDCESHLHDQGLLRARALRALGDDEAARAQAESLLATLETKGRSVMDAGEILGAATSLAALLRAVGATGHTIWRAYELAGRAALARIADLDRLRADIPQLAWIDDEDVALLETQRVRLVEHHRGFVEVLGSLLAENATDPPLIGRTVQVGICAWCKRVRGPDDVWLPLTRFQVPADATALSHGVCPRCHANAVSSALK